MDIQLISVQQVQVFLVIFCRIAGFISAVPVLSSQQNPAVVKAILTMAFSFALFPPLEGKIIPPPDFSPLAIILLVVSEVLMGGLLALVSRLIFTAMEYGANIIGFQMGFAAANIYDPQSQSQLQLISQFQNIFASLVFLIINGHFIVFQAMMRSFEMLPPGRISLAGDAVPYLMQLTSKMFVLGMQFAAPVLAVLLLSNLILGILARVFPQLNVFMLSFPINISVALGAMALTLNMAAYILAREFDDLGSRILNMIDLFTP